MHITRLWYNITLLRARMSITLDVICVCIRRYAYQLVEQQSIVLRLLQTLEQLSIVCILLARVSYLDYVEYFEHSYLSMHTLVQACKNMHTTHSLGNTFLYAYQLESSLYFLYSRQIHTPQSQVLFSLIRMRHRLSQHATECQGQAFIRSQKIMKETYNNGIQKI